METISFRIVEDAEFPVFRQYLLPDAARLAAGGKHDILVLGAVCGTMACGAAALSFEEQDSGAVVAELISLFLDPLVRRQGVGSEFLACCLDAASESGRPASRPSGVAPRTAPAYMLETLAAMAV